MYLYHHLFIARLLLPFFHGFVSTWMLSCWVGIRGLPFALREMEKIG